MAVDRIVSFGVEKLWELLSRESERLNGIDEHVDGLKRQLRRLQSLLKDAYAKKHKSERVTNYLEDVQVIVYDAEVVIESFLLNESRGKEKGIKKRLKIFAFYLVDRRGFASDIEGITRRISEVIEGMQSFGIHQIIDGGRSLSLQERQREQRDIRQTFSNNCESDLVGVKQSVEELVGRLVETDNHIPSSFYIRDGWYCHFDGFSWVCVSQETTRKHIWQRILQDLSQHDDEDILKMDEYTLQGWKMLLTSRNEGVGLHANPTCFAFKSRILTPEESWNLCQRIVFPWGDKTEFSVDEELEAMGKKMVTYCGRLPLAVKVLGGLLAT